MKLQGSERLVVLPVHSYTVSGLSGKCSMDLIKPVLTEAAYTNPHLSGKPTKGVSRHVHDHRDQTRPSVVNLAIIHQQQKRLINFSCMLYPSLSHASLFLALVTLCLSGTHSFSATHMHTQQEQLPVAETRLCHKRTSASGHKGVTGLWISFKAQSEERGKRHPSLLIQQIWFNLAD